MSKPGPFGSTYPWWRKHLSKEYLEVEESTKTSNGNYDKEFRNQKEYKEFRDAIKRKSCATWVCCSRCGYKWHSKCLHRKPVCPHCRGDIL